MTPEFEERRKLSIWDRLEEIGDEARTGHKAHRTRIEQLEHQMDALSNDLTTLAATVDRLANAPVEANKIRFSLQAQVLIVSTTIAIIGGVYGFSNRVLTRLDAMQQHETDYVKLQDERNARIMKDLSDMKAQMTMQDLKMTNLRETVLTRGGK